MAQVMGHEVDGKGDHFLTLDDGRVVKVPFSPTLEGAGWGEVLRAAGGTIDHGYPAAKPRGKTRSG
jgi:hypothetical protein